MNEKKGYTTPLMEIVRLETVPMLNSVSGAGDASDIGYGGLGNDEYGD